MSRHPERTALNALWGSTIADELYTLGVRTICTSAGYRNSPVAIAFADHGGFKIYTHIDERSSGFFALGTGKYSGSPAVLLCTSGTAAANYLPAVIEAYLSNVALIVLTADRPPELRQSGANQTIDQVNLYGSHVHYFADLAMPDIDRTPYLRRIVDQAYAVAMGSPGGPVHINIPFREPLGPLAVGDEIELEERTNPSGASVSPRKWALPDLSSLLDDIAAHRSGVILVGPMAPDANFPAELAVLSKRTGYPILAEVTSECRFDPALHNQRIDHFDALLKHPQFEAAFRPQVIIRFGARLTSKAIAAAVAREDAALYVIHESAIYDDADYAAKALIAASPIAVCRGLTEALRQHEPDHVWRDRLFEYDDAAQSVLQPALTDEAPFFEGHIARAVSQSVPSGGLLYVGNSMPVRDLETFGQANDRLSALTVLSNRGASGIDGMISSAIGAAEESRRATVLYLGDLSFLHDLGGLVTAQNIDANLTIVVSNNNGGGIFSFLPIADQSDNFRSLFTLPHGLQFSEIAKMFHFDYALTTSAVDLRERLKLMTTRPGVKIIEVTTEIASNVAIHDSIGRDIGAAIATVH